MTKKQNLILSPVLTFIALAAYLYAKSIENTAGNQTGQKFSFGLIFLSGLSLLIINYRYRKISKDSFSFYFLILGILLFIYSGIVLFLFYYFQNTNIG